MAFDTSRPLASRIAAAEGLRSSVSRFGPLLAPDQRTRLLRARDRAGEPELRQAFENVISTLRSIGLPAVDSAPPEAPNTD